MVAADLEDVAYVSVVRPGDQSAVSQLPLAVREHESRLVSIR
jgi:hypothetical protein